MRTLADEFADWGYAAYDRAWSAVARGGLPSVALDARMFGWRYLSLNALVLTRAEADQLAYLTRHFGRLLDVASQAVLDDPDWWPELTWPWPAIELARQEPPHPDGHATLFGRFDWLLDAARHTWRLVEYNADTPSGGRETHGLEPAAWRLHGGRRRGLSPLGRRLAPLLARALDARLRAWSAEGRRPVRLVGVVSSHSWLEDHAQAWWLAGVLCQAGWPALVGDVTDLSVRAGQVRLRGLPVDALYRFYPVERLYRHGVFGPLVESALDGRLLLINGLRGFLAQSKAALAWLWANRGDPRLGRGARRLIERHLPPVVPARDASAPSLLADAVVKHVNGREGDSVVFGDTLDAAAWEARLLEGGYVVQQRVDPVAVPHVEVDEVEQVVRCVEPRYACVGAFCIGGQFGGCYTRLDGLVTTARATFVPTLVEGMTRGPGR
jgi:glutathionylspermidine synthase